MEPCDYLVFYYARGLLASSPFAARTIPKHLPMPATLIGRIHVRRSREPFARFSLFESPQEQDGHAFDS
ncbi:MAG: hypothetical protein GQ526_08345 [Ardenticatenales bacterium]|nr:hypothetical protein [Ardenticatenales bacterium]